MNSQNPQPRLLRQIVAALKSGAVVAYPTERGYAIGCDLANGSAYAFLHRLRTQQKKATLTLLCDSISQAACYSFLDNRSFRFLKREADHLSFLLPATQKVPRAVYAGKRKIIEIGIASHPISLALIKLLTTPLLSVCLGISQAQDIDALAMQQPLIRQKLTWVLDGGPSGDVLFDQIDLTGSLL